MTNRIQTLRSNVAGNRPTGRLPGELYVNWPDGQLGTINSTSNAQDLIAIRFFSTSASYNVGDHVIQGGSLYKATSAVSPGSFNAAQWVLVGTSTITMGDTPPNNPSIGALWWDSVGGNLYVWYNDGSSSQWVIAVNNAPPASTTLPLMNGTAATGGMGTWARADHIHPSDTSRLSVSGGTLTGPISVPSGNSIPDYLPLVGGTLTGALGGTSASFSGNVNGSSWVGNGNVYPNYSANSAGCVAASASATTMQLNGNNYVSAQSGVAYLVAGGVSCSWNGSTFVAANVSCSGNVNCSAMAAVNNVTGANGIFTASCYVRSGSNPGYFMQSAGGTTSYGVVYSTGSAVYLSQQSPVACNFYLTGNCWATPSSGNNFILTPGAGYQGGGGAWQAYSDERIKTVEREYEIGLEEVLKLRPIVYRYKGNDKIEKDAELTHRWAREKPFVGLVAQEVEKVFPGMITKTRGFIDDKEVDDLRSFDSSPLIYALINAIKTLTARIEELEGAR